MPELPEVETVVRNLRPLVTGRRLAQVIHASPLMAESAVGPFESSLAGRRVESLVRQGKWMFFNLSQGRVLVVHLGMTGRLAVVRPNVAIREHTHLRIKLDRGGELRFSDPRRFGRLLLCDEGECAARFGARELGPDALEVSIDHFVAGIKASRRTVKSILLDQKFVAGIGNIYADEMLFDAGIRPARPGRRLRRQELDRLHKSMGNVLRLGIRYNGTTIRDYVTGEGVPGSFQERLLVYGRAGQPCRRCDGTIVLAKGVASGRSTHHCPKCQR